MAKKFVSINLQQKQQSGQVDKFIDWALGIGRVLVILTELIALGAFAYRFTLDQQLITLTTKIKSEQAIVASLQTNETNYRNLQDRLSLASTNMDITQKRIKIYQDTIGFAPQGLTFNSIGLYPTDIQIDADVTSIVPLSVFVNALKSYPAIDSVSINQISNKTAQSVINISITANLKQEYTINATNN